MKPRTKEVSHVGSRGESSMQPISLAPYSAYSLDAGGVESGSKMISVQSTSREIEDKKKTAKAESRFATRKGIRHI